MLEQEQLQIREVNSGTQAAPGRLRDGMGYWQGPTPSASNLTDVVAGAVRGGRPCRGDALHSAAEVQMGSTDTLNSHKSRLVPARAGGGADARGATLADPAAHRIRGESPGRARRVHRRQRGVIGDRATGQGREERPNCVISD